MGINSKARERRLLEIDFFVHSIKGDYEDGMLASVESLIPLQVGYADAFSTPPGPMAKVASA